MSADNKCVIFCCDAELSAMLVRCPAVVPSLVLHCPKPAGSWLQPSVFPGVVNAVLLHRPLSWIQSGDSRKGLCSVCKSHAFEGRRRADFPSKKSTESGPSSTARTEGWESSGGVRRKETPSETLSHINLQVLQYLVVLWHDRFVFNFSTVISN